MIGVPKLAALIHDVFVDCLDTFPASDLIQLMHSEHVNQEILLFRLSGTSNPMQKPAHLVLIKRALGESTNLHHYRYIAAMLRAYSRHDVQQLLMEMTDLNDDRSIWLVREVENARKQRLIKETLQWIR
jgi:secreted Zn-dependent insulinase-like peptidase